MAKIIKDVPCLLHGGDYNPEQWISQKETIWKQDMEYAKKADINTLSVGIFSWSHLEPEDGVYDFSWMDEVLDMLAENGIKAILSTPSGGYPPWLAEKYPSVLRVTNDRRRKIYGGRHNACFSSPDFRRKILEINTRLVIRYKDHPALGAWHISNEYNSNCHCPLCRQKFHNWLKNRYEDIESLNNAWWNSFWSHRYNSFDQIESPTVPSSLGETASCGHRLSWQRFLSDLAIDFFCHEIKPMREHTPDIAVTANLMRGFSQIDYFKLGRQMDFSSWDNYPVWKGDIRDISTAYETAFWHDMFRGVGGQKPFMMMESAPSSVNWQPCNSLRKPGTLIFQSLQAIAHGSDSVQYFQYRKSRGGSEQHHGAVIDHTGRCDTRVFKEVAEVGRVLKQLSEVAGSVTRNNIALIYDWENRWSLENAFFIHRDNKQYDKTVITHHTALLQNGVGIDMVDQNVDLSPYKIVIAPMSYMLRREFAGRVQNFIESGGTFVMTYCSGYVDEENLCFLGGFPGPLKSIAGIWAEEIDALDETQSNTFVWKDKEYKIKDLCEIINTETAQTLAVYGSNFYKGMPALTLNYFGKGKCYYIAARTDEEFLKDFYGEIINESQINPAFSDLPPGVVSTVRFGNDKQYLFIMNSRTNKERLALKSPVTEILTGRLYENEVTLEPLSVYIFMLRGDKE